MKPTHFLHERTPSDCALGLEDVEFLRSVHRKHLKVWPAGRAGWYRVVPAAYVGTIDAPGCRIVIRPKIPVANFLYLLAPHQVGGSEPDAPPEGEGLADLLATRLTALLDGLARAGLHRAYAERAEAGPFLRGSLDAAEQVRHGLTRAHVVHSRADEFTCDTACNRAARAAGEFLLGCPFLRESTRAGLRGALAGYAGVQSVPLTRELLAAAEPGPTTEAYRPLWEFCWLLLDGLSLGTGGSPASFLVNLERVFESYVAGQAREYCRFHHEEEAVRVCVQPAVRGTLSEARQPELVLRPDLTLGVPGATGVLDTKWKRLPRTSLPHRDVHQVVAYCSVLGASLAVLVYPGRRDATWSYRLGCSPAELWVHKLRVIGAPWECRRSVQRLVRSMVRRLRPQRHA